MYWCQTGSRYTFEDFKALWKQLRFSYIHHARPKEMDYNEWMQRLYSSTLGFLYSPQPMMAFVGTLYTLYALYHTQLKSPPALIRVSLGACCRRWRDAAGFCQDRRSPTVPPAVTWKYLQRLYKELKNQRMWEPYHVFRKLCEDKCFCFTAYAPVGPQSAPTTTLQYVPVCCAFGRRQLTNDWSWCSACSQNCLQTSNKQILWYKGPERVVAFPPLLLSLFSAQCR